MTGTWSLVPAKFTVQVHCIRSLKSPRKTVRPNVLKNSTCGLRDTQYQVRPRKQHLAGPLQSQPPVHFLAISLGCVESSFKSFPTNLNTVRYALPDIEGTNLELSHQDFLHGQTRRRADVTRVHLPPQMLDIRTGSAVPALLEAYTSSPFELPARIALVTPHQLSLAPDELSCSGPGPAVEEQPEVSSSPPLQNQPQRATANLSPATSTRSCFTTICLPPADVIPCSGGYLVVRHPRRHATRGPSPIARPAAAAMLAPQPSRQPQPLLLAPAPQLHSPLALWQASRPQSPARNSPASIALPGVPVGQLPRNPTPSEAFQVALALREQLARCRQSTPQPLPLPAPVGAGCGGGRNASSRLVGFGQAPALPSPFATASGAGRGPTPFAFQEAGPAGAIGRTLERARAPQQLAAQGAHAPKQPGVESNEAAVAASLLQRLAAARRQLLLQRLRGALAPAPAPAPVAQVASCNLAAWPQGCCPQQQQ